MLLANCAGSKAQEKARQGSHSFLAFLRLNGRMYIYLPREE